MRWWPISASAGKTAEAAGARAAASDLDQQRAIVIAYGRILRAISTEPSPDYPAELRDLTTGQVYVCGVGMLPIPLVVAVAEVEDAQVRQREHPDDPAAAAALDAARRGAATVAAQLEDHRQADRP